MGINILAIDGGGMKGIVSVMVLMRLEKYIKLYTKDEKKGIMDYFDLVAGTSTGSILTALLLCPDENGKAKYQPEDALNLYLSKGKEMFQKRHLYPINSLFGLCKSRYSNHGFIEGLKEYFGTLKISELLKPCLIITYDMMARRTLFLNSISSKKNPSRDFSVVDAVLSSCTAPTYFPPVCVTSVTGCKSCLIDGGVAANNPTMSALVEALKMPGVKTINDICILSVGNVTNVKSYSCDKAESWGIAEFALPLVDIFMEASEEIVDYQVRKLYDSRNISNQYLRIEAIVETEVPSMDDTSENALKRLIEFGNQIVNKEELSIRSFAKMLVERSRERK